MSLIPFFNDPFLTTTTGFPGFDRSLGWPSRSTDLGLGDLFKTVSQVTPRAFDIVERKDKFELITDAPGMTPDEIKVELTDDNVLTVSGSHEETKYVGDKGQQQQGEQQTEGGDRVWRSERRSYQFTRCFALPDNADPDNICAAVDKGVLTVCIPKRPEAKKPEPKRITVSHKA
jgi:HSP20 family protein